MKKFDSLVNQVYANILLEAPLPASPVPAIDQTGGNPPPGDVLSQPPAPATNPEPEEPKPVSSEGLRNLVDLIQRALVISPDSLDSTDKAIFNDRVTIQNAIEKQQQLSDIIDRINPPQIEVGNS